MQATINTILLLSNLFVFTFSKGQIQKFPDIKGDHFKSIIIGDTVMNIGKNIDCIVLPYISIVFFLIPIEIYC